MKQSKRRKHLDPNTLQLIRQIVGGVLALTLVAILVVSVWYVSRLPALTIQTVEVSGGETIAHELVRQLVDTELEGAYLRLIPRRFAWLYPKADIEATVQSLDRVASISLSVIEGTTLAVSFTEYIPDTLWCATDATECVFLDQTGYAFARAPSLTGGAFLRLEKLGVTPVTGVSAFAEEEYRQVLELVALLERNGWFVSTVAVDLVGDAYLSLVDGGELKVVLADDPERIVENLLTIVNAGQFAGLGPGEFAYIDLRFGNKVFVNELGAATTSAATSSEALLVE
jgi:cell division septal protein FtsQ